MNSTIEQWIDDLVAGVALALGNEGHPVVVSLVFESNLDALGDRRSERQRLGNRSNQLPLSSTRSAADGMGG